MGFTGDIKFTKGLQVPAGKLIVASSGRSIVTLVIQFGDSQVLPETHEYITGGFPCYRAWLARHLQL